LTLERAFAREKRRLDDLWADLVYEGLWFSPLRSAIDAFAASCRGVVSGTVRLRFGPGSCAVTGRAAPKSLYDHGLATYDKGDVFRHEDAAGFIRLWGLPAKQWAKTHD
jgi:argininosuccinate synthase